jgi:UPF0755 protein
VVYYAHYTQVTVGVYAKQYQQYPINRFLILVSKYMKSKTPSFAIRFFFLLIVVVGVLVFGAFFGFDGLRPVDPADTTVVPFIVSKGETVNTIVSRLAAERLIRSRLVFYLYIKFTSIDSRIQAGNFQLNRSMQTKDVAKALTIGVVDVKITTLEGWRVEEIAAKLSSELGIPEREFVGVAQEGYMFPDTYLVSKDATAGGVSELFKSTFEKKLTSEMRLEIARQKRTINDVVVLASILEREGRTDMDRPVIAGILLKRIKEGWTLDVDATLQYALGYQVTDHTWWKKELTDADKKIKSPYNTYTNLGLPPGPISNPGLSSLKAAVNPQDSAYWFYLHDPTGQIHYAKTMEEHNENIQKYLR